MHGSTRTRTLRSRRLHVGLGSIGWRLRSPCPSLLAQLERYSPGDIPPVLLCRPQDGLCYMHSQAGVSERGGRMKIPHWIPCAALAVACSLALSAQQTPRGFHTVACIKVKLGKTSEYPQMDHGRVTSIRAGAR